MPNVTIITPTTPNRMPMLQRLSDMINAQTYRDFEWLTDDGEGTIGEKRNRLCERARGQMIVHMDDDDFYHPEYIERALLHLGEADMTGLSDAYFLSEKQAWKYLYLGTQPYVMEATMLYRRDSWQRSPFAETNIGEGLPMLANIGRIKPHKHIDMFVASIHGGNTASHNSIQWMQEVDIESVRKIREQILNPIIQ